MRIGEYREKRNHRISLVMGMFCIDATSGMMILLKIVTAKVNFSVRSIEVFRERKKRHFYIIFMSSSFQSNNHKLAGLSTSACVIDRYYLIELRNWETIDNLDLPAKFIQSYL